MADQADGPRDAQPAQLCISHSADLRVCLDIAKPWSRPTTTLCFPLNWTVVSKCKPHGGCITECNCEYQPHGAVGAAFYECIRQQMIVNVTQAAS